MFDSSALKGMKLSELQEISSEFAADSDIVFYGCFGAIDGLAVRIKSPT